MLDKLYKNKRVVVFGGTGFFGSHLCGVLSKAGAQVVALGRNDWNLLDSIVPLKIANLLAESDYVFHLAGYNGGIGFNLKYPASIFAQNTIMGLNVLDACVQNGVPKVMSVVASCAYPENQFLTAHNQTTAGYITRRELMKESGFFDGEPNLSVACHGYAKRNLQLATKFFNQQFGLNAVCGCVTTLYGPGDSFDPERTKVMGSLIAKFVDAQEQKKEFVELWGDGSPLREFIYVQDAVYDLAYAAAWYEDSAVPLNVGCGQEINIASLAQIVASVVGYEGEIRWDASKPNGQMRKKLDSTKWNALWRQHMGEEKNVYHGLAWGIAITVDWYKEQRKCKS
jgi:GDP-L-fucose synthase